MMKNSGQRKEPKMQTVKHGMMIATCVWLLATVSANAFYNPQTGRWLNRDPVKEAGGKNLFAAANNNLVHRIDSLGLAGDVPTPGVIVCRCCACAICVTITSVMPIYEGSGLYGHSFNVDVVLQYGLVKKLLVGDPRLKGLEKSNRFPKIYPGAVANQWYDVYPNVLNNDLVPSWTGRDTPCPGMARVSLSDKPIADITAGNRTMEFHIIVESAAGCPGAQPRAEAKAKQALEGPEASPGMFATQTFQ